MAKQALAEMNADKDVDEARAHLRSLRADIGHLAKHASSQIDILKSRQNTFHQQLEKIDPQTVELVQKLKFQIRSTEEDLYFKERTSKDSRKKLGRAKKELKQSLAFGSVVGGGIIAGVMASTTIQTLRIEQQLDEISRAHWLYKNMEVIEQSIALQVQVADLWTMLQSAESVSVSTDLLKKAVATADKRQVWNIPRADGTILTDVNFMKVWEMVEFAAEKN